MQDCTPGMGTCSIRTCQFPSYLPSSPGIEGMGHTTLIVLVLKLLVTSKNVFILV